MGNTNASKRIFERFDKSHTGSIQLYDFINQTNHESDSDTSIFCSLLTLYHFDFSKAGTINFKEFVEMEKFVQKVQKQQKKHKHTSSAQNLVVMSRNNSHSAHLDTLSEESVTPAMVQQQTPSRPRSPTSPHNIHSHHGSFDNLSEPQIHIQPPSNNAEEELKEIKEEIAVRLLPSFHKELYNQKGRLSFLNWLFKLSDVHRTGQVDRHDLAAILTAVKNDGIDLHSLLFEEDHANAETEQYKKTVTTEEEEEDEVDEIVSRLITQYDTKNAGYLTRDEFFKLGELILNLYEARHAEMNKGQQIVGPYRLTHLLGEGGYGQVKYATHIETGEKRAIKIVKRGSVSDMSKLDVEIQAMQMLQHPHVVQLYQVLEDQEHIYLVMELCGGGSLYEQIKDEPFSEELARFYFTQLIDGLEYCHKNGVCHRDLRLENLLLDNYGHLKITDFGQARIFKKGWDLFSTQLVGSLYHLSPEQINGKVYSGEKIDIWSAGIILYCFLTARLPFSSSDVMSMFEDIKNAKYEYPDHVTVSEDAKDLICKMICVDPKKRTTLDEIKEHKWFIGQQQLPKLMYHKLDDEHLNQTHEFVDLKPIRQVLETIFAEKNINIVSLASKLEAKKSKLDVVTPIIVKNNLSFPLHSNLIMKLQLQPNEDVLDFFILKCIYAEKNLKFYMLVSLTRDKKIAIEYQLKDGESDQFHQTMSKIDKFIEKGIDKL